MSVTKKLLSYYDEDFIMNKNREGQTLLHFSCMYPNPTALKILLEYNLTPTEVDLKGKSSVDYAGGNEELLKIFNDYKD